MPTFCNGHGLGLGSQYYDRTFICTTCDTRALLWPPQLARQRLNSCIEQVTLRLVQHFVTSTRRRTETECSQTHLRGSCDQPRQQDSPRRPSEHIVPDIVTMSVFRCVEVRSRLMPDSASVRWGVHWDICGKGVRGTGNLVQISVTDPWSGTAWRLNELTLRSPCGRLRLKRFVSLRFFRHEPSLVPVLDLTSCHVVMMAPYE